jgi:chemotaxis signal transduction protein
VVRLEGLDVLPGMTPPITGLLELRGNPLPVVDLRLGDGPRGDVLVMAAGVDALGAIVDQVNAVHDVDEFVSSGERPSGLPDYVVDVLRHARATARRTGPVLLVDLQALLLVAV